VDRNSDLPDKLGVADLATISVRADILAGLDICVVCIPEPGAPSPQDHRASPSVVLVNSKLRLITRSAFIPNSSQICSELSVDFRTVVRPACVIYDMGR
jgi:hypothetical protein